MKKLINKMVVFFLIISISICSLITVSAETIEGTQIEWYYNEDTKTLYFDGSGSIPDFFGKGLIETGSQGVDSKRTPWMDYSDSTEYIEISEGITEIGAYCFTEFYNLKSISFPKSIEMIREIFPDGKTVTEDLVIKGYQLTEAEAVSTKYGFEFEALSDIKIGDVNDDEKLNAEDSLQILKMAAKINKTYKYTSDITGEGKVDAEDALTILKKAAKI